MVIASDGVWGPVTDGEAELSSVHSCTCQLKRRKALVTALMTCQVLSRTHS